MPSLEVVKIGPELNFGPVYGIVALNSATAPAADLVRFILADEGQAILARYGFNRGDPAK